MYLTQNTHHGFVSGMHGQKLEFEAIPGDSRLFSEWAESGARKMHELYDAEDIGKIVLLSVASGTNRVVEPIAEIMGSDVVAVKTYKDSPKSVKLTPAAKLAIRKIRPDLVVAFEDVGSTGLTSSTAAVGARRSGAQRIEVLNTWKRRPRLEQLERISVVYHSIVNENLPTYTDEDCGSIGFCAMGWRFIPHGARGSSESSG
jgi:hypothetical protein